MKYDIKLISHWDAPKKDGAPLLCCPNIALPCHRLCPRTINPRKWETMRKRCYMESNYTCQASGLELGHGHVHAHELVSIDWKNQTETFARTVALDPKIHVRFIHSGRALTLFKKGDPKMPASAMLTTLEQAFRIISEWNITHSDEGPLRVCDTILDWAKEPKLEARVNYLIEQYNIKFYTFDKSCFNKKNWGKWRLVWDGKEYPTKFATQEDWKNYFKEK